MSDFKVFLINGLFENILLFPFTINRPSSLFAFPRHAGLDFASMLPMDPRVKPEDDKRREVMPHVMRHPW
ncbi:hypothetical protein OO185_03300 [Prosthecochloris sp. SCSIO W1102]|uniref:hypothetical protein n=1 Tax=Prosthecochloris sp. SCSIO W1102 TaxID=2992243 RepID=UPI00223D9EB9|nr:hypothetical protein [Prosthecochloris sp. SCSIO W1102]UZJ38975.1 hypothetical protein OO185_03300 [Prosthecochloris sp. SCSIO W1102]